MRAAALALGLVLAGCGGGGTSGGSAIFAAINHCDPIDQAYIQQWGGTITIDSGPSRAGASGVVLNPEDSPGHIWDCAVLVHEACHRELDLEFSVRAELVCNERMAQALDRAGRPDYAAWVRSLDGTHVCDLYPEAEGC